MTTIRSTRNVRGIVCKEKVNLFAETATAYGGYGIRMTVARLGLGAILEKATRRQDKKRTGIILEDIRRYKWNAV